MEALPSEIAEAIHAVMGGVKKLPKADKNPHGGYQFASIDRFLEAMNPLCADAGLIILQDELGCEVIQRTGSGGKEVTWLKLEFGFVLAHASGKLWDHQMRRSVMVPATGAQAFGSAQSYALKQFMRSMFQIPTGDKDDADFHKAEDLPAGASNGAAKQPPSLPPPNWTKEGLLAVPVTHDGQPDWTTWCGQFKEHVIGAKDFSRDKALETFGATLKNLEIENAEFHGRLMQRMDEREQRAAA